jgi:hypothetical protein
MPPEDRFITLDRENLDREHICCAFAGSKAALGVTGKKEWIRRQLDDGFVFPKLDAKAKVFIEYTPAEKAWAPIDARATLLSPASGYRGSTRATGMAKN